jgi:hypothetical protein
MSQVTVLGVSSIPPGTFVATLTGNTGGPVPPSALNNINVVGSGVISVAGNPGTNTLTISSSAISSISITGDSGGAQVSNAFTFTGGTTGLTFTGAADTFTLGGTLVVANGGTGANTFTSHGVLLGNTTGAITATAAGTTGQVLTGVTGSAPTFQSPATSSITITGDSGGGLTGNSFTFTGGSTGLTFAGAGTTETLGGTLVVSNGGTGRATLTNHGLLVGAGTGAITQLAVGTTGQVLTGVTGSDPVFASPAASSITITGDSGGGLTGNSFTFTGGSTGLTFAGAGTTETLGGTLVVANGGTGANTFTSHGVLLGNTTGAVTATAAGTTGQVLTGVTGSAPTFQSPAAASITITGDSGGGLTGSSFTFTGGSTGLTFAGAGSTETLGGTLAIANGGTNATSFTQSNGIVTYNGTRLVNYAGPQISSAGIQTNTTQPFFTAYPSATITNVTGDGTAYTLAFNSTTVNQGTYYNTGTYTFTAPVTGNYVFGQCLYTTGYAAQTIYISRAVATSGTYEMGYFNPTSEVAGNAVLIYTSSTPIPMTANDTVYFTLQVQTGTKAISIAGGNQFSSRTWGYLVC